MKVLYTSHILGDRTGTTQRIVEADTLHDCMEVDLEEFNSIIKDNGAAALCNEYGVFITDSECIESWVILSR